MTDVVIVGGGPSGSTLAYAIAKAGFDVAIVEKKTFPRDKPCGGGCDGVFAANLPEGMEIDTVTEDLVTTAVVRFHGKNERSFPIPEPIAMTQRSELDLHLVKQAEQAGAMFYDGEAVTNITRLEGGNYEVSAGAQTFYAPIVVGADGAYTVVGKLAEMHMPRTVFVASEWDVKTPQRIIDEWRGKALVDCSVLPLGYAWIFPKADHLNIGWGLPYKLAEKLNGAVELFANRLGWEPELWGYKRKAHWIPFALPGSQAVRDGIVLVGDAAGMADPTTGAGISWGVRSGQVAAPWIIHSLRAKQVRFLSNYQESYEEMIRELQAGMALRNILILTFALRRRVDAGVFEAALAAMSDKTTYRDWAREHPLKYRAGNIIQKLLVQRLI